MVGLQPIPVLSFTSQETEHGLVSLFAHLVQGGLPASSQTKLAKLDPVLESPATLIGTIDVKASRCAKDWTVSVAWYTAIDESLLLQERWDGVVR